MGVGWGAARGGGGLGGGGGVGAGVTHRQSPAVDVAVAVVVAVAASPRQVIVSHDWLPACRAGRRTGVSARTNKKGGKLNSPIVAMVFVKRVLR